MPAPDSRILFQMDKKPLQTIEIKRVIFGGFVQMGMASAAFVEFTAPGPLSSQVCLTLRVAIAAAPHAVDERSEAGLGTFLRGGQRPDFGCQRPDVLARFQH
jgi:hypothetical protein